MVVFAQKINGVTGQTEWKPEEDDYDFHQEISRSGFADMLHDYERNDKYFSALEEAIKETHRRGRAARVLDIGTGTGLLSMMAVRCGADEVVACEAFGPMADCAVDIIRDNGLADRIAVVPKRSTELTVGEDGDLKFRPNILVTEVFDTELIGEGAIETFAHALANLLDEDSIVVPAEATVYAQIVECPSLQKWNRLNDVKDDNDKVIFKIPPDIKTCPGSMSVHDVQLSQLPLESFKSISEPIPVFQFSWSGNIPLVKNRVSKVDIKALESGSAQMVFMWWDLKMDTKGKIILSCAPWWHHPSADKKADRPEDTVPWRDHWMQAVYYFPQDVAVRADEELTLISSHDEFSLWFDVTKKSNPNREPQPNPTCICGIHMSYSRTHIAYMNDREKTRQFIKALEKSVDYDTVCLCLNGGSLMGFVAAALGAKRVIYVETGIISKRVLDNFISYNDLSRKVAVVTGVEAISSADLKEISLVIGDPHFNSAILPWDNLRHGYYVRKLGLLSPSLKLIPTGCSVWVMPVQFLDLYKIKTPLGIYKGINFQIFDDLIKNSRMKSDDEIEPQPLWEYPCICKMSPVHVGDVYFDSNQTIKSEVKCDVEGEYNGFVFWLKWNLDKDGEFIINTGPLEEPKVNSRVKWDPHIRQAVKILEENRTMSPEHYLKCHFKYDLNGGIVNVNVDIVQKVQNMNE